MGEGDARNLRNHAAIGWALALLNGLGVIGFRTQAHDLNGFLAVASVTVTLIAFAYTFTFKVQRP